ncbi:MAG TPA: lytic transglycosylase domain-containing protein [Rhizomicrobium sp.]|nr:lytic transglycosylase domain-containing protein [Rhizomicrobium sp.]
MLALLSACMIVTVRPAPAAQQAAVPERGPFAEFMSEAAHRFEIPTAWISAVMRAESGGDAQAVSSKGAIGLMQIMPETWVNLRSRHGLGADPFDPHDNILAGAAYLRELHDSYGSSGFLAAYNAGPARYEDHLATGRPLPIETQTYVATVARLLRDGGAAIDRAAATVVSAWMQAPLFPNGAGRKPIIAQSSDRQTSERRAISVSAEDWTGLAPQSDGLFVRASSWRPRP